MGWSDTVYVEKLTEFSALLRQEGLAVGPQETADACAVLEVLDLTDRSTVRDALRAVYAKSRQEQAAFDSAFDGFFVSQERKEALFARRQAEAEELARRRAEAEQELQVGGKPMDLREDLQEVYATMPEEKREYLRQLLEKSKGNLERSPQLYSNFIRSVFMRFLLEQQMMMEDAAVGSEALDPDLALLYRDISQFKDADIPRATALIARVAQQLSAELSKRRRRGATAASLISKRPSAAGWRPGAASTGCPSAASATAAGGWWCCATCPGPCSSSPSSPCASSSPWRRCPTPPGPSSSPRSCVRWTPSPSRRWTPSAPTSAPPASTAGART